jgi:Tol biopolymer transport system component
MTWIKALTEKMKAWWETVRRFSVKYPLWAGVASVVAVSLVLGGGYALVSAAMGSGSNTTGDPSVSADASPSADPSASAGPSPSDLTPLPSPTTPADTGAPGLTPAPGGSAIAGDGVWALGPPPPGDLPEGVVAELFGADDNMLVTDASWSSDSERFVVVALGSNGLGGAYVFDRDGTGKRLVSSAQTGVHSATWSPDGQRLAIVGSLPGGGLTRSLVVVDVMDGSVTQIVNGDLVSAATWAPDGSELLFDSAPYVTGGTLPSDWTVYEYDFASGGSHQWAVGARPAFSPSGIEVALLYDSDGDGTLGTWVLGVDAQPLRGIGSGEDVSARVNDIVGPQWSPDGRWLSYCAPVTTPYKSRDCYLAESDSGVTLEWSRESLWPRYAFSPDMSRVVYKNDHIVVRDLATGDETIFTDARSYDDIPVWTPDSRYLLRGRTFTEEAFATWEANGFAVTSADEPVWVVAEHVCVVDLSGNLLARFAPPSVKEMILTQSWDPVLSPDGDLALMNVDFYFGAYRVYYLYEVPDGMLGF